MNGDFSVVMLKGFFFSDIVVIVFEVGVGCVGYVAGIVRAVLRELLEGICCVIVDDKVVVFEVMLVVFVMVNGL